MHTPSSLHNIHNSGIACHTLHRLGKLFLCVILATSRGLAFLEVGISFILLWEPRVVVEMVGNDLWS